MRTRTIGALVIGTAAVAWLATAPVEADDLSDLAHIRPESLPAATPAEELLPAATAAVENFPRSAGRHMRLATLLMRHLKESGDESVLEGVHTHANGHTHSHAQTTSAEALLRRALELQPGDAAAELGLARALNAQHRFDDAIDVAIEVLEAEPESSGAVAALFDGYVGIGRYDDAAAVLTSMDEVEDPAMVARRAQMAELMGNDDEAMGLLVQAARRAVRRYQSRQQVAWYLYRLGEFNRLRGRVPMATEFLGAALRLDPGSLPAAVARARIARVTDAPARALQHWVELTDRTPRPELLAELGDLYEALGEHAKAEAAWARAIEIGTRAGAAEDRPMARLLADRDWMPEEALVRARRDLTHRQDIEAWDTLAWAAYRAGELDEAAEAAAQALRLGTRRADFHHHAALIAEARGEVAAAAHHRAEVTAIDPTFEGPS